MTNPVLDRVRADFLKARIASTKDKGNLPAWHRTEKNLPLVELEVDWVRFSTLNHRTKAEQKREVQQSNNPGLFSGDPLGSAAQKAQLNILSSQEGFDDLKEDLKKRRQQEPAVVTAEGVLINGNRRAAALRSLFKEENHLDARYIRCLVLPEDANSSEIIDLETELQIARDFKEGYSWINEALLIEELYESCDCDFDKLSRKVHRTTAEVRSMHEKIQQVNQLVELSNGTRFHLDFQPHESAFDELTKHIKNKSHEEMESVKSAYFLGTLSGVTYRELRNLRCPEASKLVIQEIENDPTIAPLLELVKTNEEKQTEADDLLDDVLGEESKDDLTDVLSFLIKKKHADSIDLPGSGSVTVNALLQSLKGKIEAAAREAREEQRDQNTLDAPVQRIIAATVDVHRAIQTLAKARLMDGWDETEFIGKLATLKAAIKTLEKTE